MAKALKIYIKGLGNVNFPEGTTPEMAQDAIRKGLRSGELETAAGLPMDPESKRARAELWGGEEDYYHGSTHDIDEFKTNIAHDRGDWGGGTYASSSPEDASASYATPEGPDLRSRIEGEKEVWADNYAYDADELAMDFNDLEPEDPALQRVLEEYGASYDDVLDATQADDNQLAIDVMSDYQATNQLTGPNEGVVYPLKINKDDYAVIGGDDRTRLESKDYMEEARAEGEIKREDFEEDWEFEDALMERGYELQDMDDESLYGRLNEALQNAGVYGDEVTQVLENAGIEDGELDLTWLDQYIRSNDISAEGPDGPVFGGPASAAIIQELGYPGVIDRTVDSKFGTNKQGFGGMRMQGMPGVDPSTEHIVTFPGNEHRIRSRFANFDFGNASSKDILKMVAPVMVSLGLAANTQEAEAGGLTAAMRQVAGALATPERLVQLGYIKPHMAGDPKQVQRGMNRYMKNATNNKAFFQREVTHADSPLTLKARGNMEDRTIKTAEDMVGKTGVPVVGDRSRTDVDLFMPELDEVTRVEGGANYPLEHINTGDAWASMLEAAKKKQRNFDLAADLGDSSDVLGVYSAMGPDAINFSTPIAEYLVKATQQGTTTKAARRAIDKKLRNPTEKVRKLWPDVGASPKNPDKAKRGWVGIDHPDAMDQLLGRNGYPNIGNRRTAFVTEFGSKKAEELGFPVWGDIARAATEPELGMNPETLGESGFSMFDAVPGGQVHDASKHQTYDTAIPGEYFGGLEEQLPPEVMWPQTWADLGADKPRTRSQRTGSFMMLPSLYENFDERWLEGVQKYMRSGEIPQYQGRPEAIPQQKKAYDALSKAQRGNADPRVLGGMAALGVGAAAGLAPEESEAGVGPAARALGYTKNLYHGTGSPDLTDVDMDMVDLGLHMGTPEQASKRLTNVAQDREYNGQQALEAPNVLPLNYRQGKTLNMDDVGRWDDSQAVLDTLRNSDDPELKAWANENVPYMQSDATDWDSNDEWINSQENRSWLDDINAKMQELGYDTIEYRNEVENSGGRTASYTPEQWEERDAISAERNKIYEEALRRAPDPRKDALDALLQDENFSAAELDAIMDAEYPERLPQYTPEEQARVAEIDARKQEIEADRIARSNSYIALDPANIRSEYAEFNPANEGKAGLMGGLGALTVGAVAAGGSDEAQALPKGKAARALMEEYGMDAQKIADAEAMGFDTNEIFWRGGALMPEGGELPSGRAGGVYFSPQKEYADSYGTDMGGETYPYLLRHGEQLDMSRNPEHEQLALDAFHEAGGWQQAQEHNLVFEDEQLASRAMQDPARPEVGVGNPYRYNPEFDDQWEVLDEPENDILYDLVGEAAPFDTSRHLERNKEGYEGLLFPDDQRNAFRRLDAKFDPKNIESKDVLAGLGSLAVGAGAAGGSGEAQATELDPFNDANKRPIPIGQGMAQPNITPESVRADEYNELLRRQTPQEQEETRTFADDLQGVGATAEVLGRAMGGMSLGGLKAIWDLAGGATFNDAVKGIDEMTAKAFEGFDPTPEMMENMQYIMEKTGENARSILGDDVVDLYNTGFERAGDAAYNRFEKWGYPQVGAVLGSAIRAGEMLSPI